MAESLSEKLLAEFHANPDLRDKFVYFVLKDKLIEVQEQVLFEVKKLRENSDKRFEAQQQELKQLREDMNKRFEAVDKRFEAQQQELKQLREDMNKRFEAVDKRFEVVDKRFEELIANMNKRFEAVDKRFEELIANMNKRFEAVDKRFEETNNSIKAMLMEIKAMRKELNSVHNRISKQEQYLKGVGGMNLELQDMMLFRAIVYAKGYDAKNLEWRKKFPNPENKFGLSEVELDLFQEEPLVIGEVTSYTLELVKVTKFLRKKKFIEWKYGKEPYALFITYGFHPDIAEEAKQLLDMNNIVLIAAGENRDAVLDLDWEYFNDIHEQAKH